MVQETLLYSTLCLLEKLYSNNQFWIYQNMNVGMLESNNLARNTDLVSECGTQELCHLQLPTHHRHLDVGTQRNLANSQPSHSKQARGGGHQLKSRNHVGTTIGCFLFIGHKKKQKKTLDLPQPIQIIKHVIICNLV